MKVLIVIPSLAMGGAEKIALFNASALRDKGHDVTLLTLYDTPDFYAVPQGVSRKKLSLSPVPFCKNPRTAFKRVSELRQLFKKLNPGVVITHMLLAPCVAAYSLGIKYIMAEHVPLKEQKIPLYRKVFLKRAARVVVITEEEKNYALKLGINAAAIPNPAVRPVVKKDARPEFFGAGKNIVALSRLSPEKGLDKMLDIWRKAYLLFPSWQLNIIGEGAERPRLERIILDNRIKQVVLPGMIDDVGAAYKYADAFIMTSSYETFPTALCEAMSMGLPSIAFETGGACAIIRNGIDGILVKQGDVPAFRQQLKELMFDEEKRLALGRAAGQVTERFGIRAYASAWNNLLKEI